MNYGSVTFMSFFNVLRCLLDMANFELTRPTPPELKVNQFKNDCKVVCAHEQVFCTKPSDVLLGMCVKQYVVVVHVGSTRCFMRVIVYVPCLLAYQIHCLCE